MNSALNLRVPYAIELVYGQGVSVFVVFCPCSALCCLEGALQLCPCSYMSSTGTSKNSGTVISDIKGR